MVRLNILDRFRPVGSPGLASPAGVPDDSNRVEMELAPVFAILAPLIESCSTLVAGARKEAEEEIDRAREQAAAVVAQARLDSAGERARAAARVAQTAARMDEVMLAKAVAEATELSATATPGLGPAARRIAADLVSELLSDEQ